jgi:hypothetical protein
MKIIISIIIEYLLGTLEDLRNSIINYILWDLYLFLFPNLKYLLLILRIILPLTNLLANIFPNLLD